VADDIACGFRRSRPGVAGVCIYRAEKACGGGALLPEYLVCGGSLLDYAQAFWPEAYPEHVEWFQHVNGNGVWRLSVEGASIIQKRFCSERL
jgi:hypothetical protein